MNDEEITRLCAKAMCLAIEKGTVSDWYYLPHESKSMPKILYAPLHNDGQMAALVKYLKLRIDRTRGIPEKWGVYSRRDYGDMVVDDSLNRAVCICAAGLQAQKKQA